MSDIFENQNSSYCRLTYPVERLGETTDVELPFVVGIMADLNKSRGERSASLRERRFIEFDEKNINDLFNVFHPCIDVNLGDIPGLVAQPGCVSLTFSSFEELEFKNISKQARMVLEKLYNKTVPDSELDRVCDLILLNEGLHELRCSIQGIRSLIDKKLDGSNIKIKVLDVSKEELSEDQRRSYLVQDSDLFFLVYEAEYGVFEGEPYSIILADYQVCHKGSDIDIIECMANIGAEAGCFFISSASPELLGLNAWNQLASQLDFERVFVTREYLKWREFRDDENSRFVALAVPVINDSSEKSEHTVGEVYIIAAELINSFSGNGLWDFGDARCDSIGNENSKTNEQVSALARTGFIAVDLPGKRLPAPLGKACSAQRVKHYHKQSAVAIANTMSLLAYNLIVAQFIRYITTISRDAIGSFRDTEDLNEYVNSWIQFYVKNNNANEGDRDEAIKPLAEAKVRIDEVSGEPGAIKIGLHVRVGVNGFDSPPCTQHEFKSSGISDMFF